MHVDPSTHRRGVDAIVRLAGASRSEACQTQIVEWTEERCTAPSPDGRPSDT